MRQQMKLTYAIFEEEEAASDAVDALTKVHFDPDKITVLTRRSGDDSQVRIERLPISETTRGGRGAAMGAVAGVVGGLALAFLGPFTGVGPLFLAFGGAIGGAVTGAAVGLLAGLDWGGDEIEFDQEHFPPGAFLVGVRTQKRHDAARDALREAGANAVFERTPNMAAEEFSHVRPESSSEVYDEVEGAGEESFPASDSPAWTPGG